MTEPDFRFTFPKDIADAVGNPKDFYHQAYWMARCSLFVYPDEGEKNEAAADRIRKTIEAWGLGGDRFAFITNGTTQCFVAGNDDVIIVCFRGTEKNRWDIVADLVAIPSGDKHFVGRAHAGFNQALSCAFDAGSGLKVPGVPERISQFRNNGQKVWFTGHSLGGAVAELAVARLIHDEKLAPQDIGGIITFGQPRVGNVEFASEYDDRYKLRERHVRFVNNNDVVPRTPLAGGFKIGKLPFPEFRHVGRVAFVNRAEEIQPYVGFFRLLLGRAGSRFKALFRKPGGNEKLISRFLPGLFDHSMVRYQLALSRKIVAL